MATLREVGLSVPLVVCAATLSACSNTTADQQTGAVCTIITEAHTAALVVIISGQGPCSSGIEATLEVNNATGGECGSDVLADLSPGDHRMWFASTSGEGGATGRWEARPANQEGVGFVVYPPGGKSWPITLPQLDPGTYTFSLPSAACDATHEVLASTFRISTPTE